MRELIRVSIKWIVVIVSTVVVNVIGFLGLLPEDWETPFTIASNVVIFGLVIVSIVLDSLSDRKKDK